ncbi:oxygen-independent coproporphyrinogen III oxidase [Rhodospirillum rubrum]|uniref:oxygen-independent coproporphyrinogen III oxidase n=1 Tax=Rhodospirillum rubrum TaxID=1085 RepID=UPI00190536E3|nr:oxygen-independent coproporphyrinogen III oxidase [Rhodospirillum rubrum]MBK1664385.1 oxygen-independent coproporphyrinogen III oxidase [Rhodospirillum rubrum]MBK1677821.1 oxygen-independent coproporphyrinogen III oxidase [Rhodospirillum rubrum]
MDGETNTLHPEASQASAISAKTQALASKYDLRLPRYTSYPTAPHFHGGVGAETYGQWLEALEPGSPASLYLHVAYCAEMCWFCGCHTRVTKRYDPVADYLDALLSESAMVAKRLSAPLKVTHVHFGGGTPTILTADDFVRTIDTLRADFGLADVAEIAVEMDPRTATLDYVKAMARAGVTRASIGVQDFKDDVQKSINRIQPIELVAQVIDWLRDNGITDINMDLVYGLPHQTTSSVLHTIDQAIAMAPRRVSLFGYAHVPWMKKHMRLIDEASLPDVPERWSQYLAATAHFQALGYVAVGLDHFAAPDDEMARALSEGILHRNFQGYTTDTAPALIGLGASGIGYLPQGYVANEGEIGAYKELIRGGSFATKRGIAVSTDDMVRRSVIERLMCDLAVDLGAVAREYGLPDDTFATELAAMDSLEGDGVLVREGGVVHITELGRPLVRAVCAKFDRYLKMGEQRHSRAV